MPLHSVVLGTAQLSGFVYGNLQHPLDRAASTAILDAAWTCGIRAFDTAEGYGAAASRLADWLQARGHTTATITTKITSGRGFVLRAHGASQRFAPWHRSVLLHGRGTIGEWRTNAVEGFSLYTAMDVATVLSYARPKRLQLPLATFRQRPDDSWPPCDVRSVFEAGRTVRDPEKQLREARGVLRPQDRLVVGVDHPAQLDALVAAFT